MLHLQLQGGLCALKQGLNLSGPSVKTLHILLSGRNVILETGRWNDHTLKLKYAEHVNSNTTGLCLCDRMNQKNYFTQKDVMSSSVWKDGDWANAASLLAVQLSTPDASWTAPSHRVRPRCRFSVWESVRSNTCQNRSRSECDTLRLSKLDLCNDSQRYHLCSETFVLV